MTLIPTQNATQRAFTAIEILIVVLIIGILVGAAVPGFMHARESTRTKVCVSGLRVLSTAKDEWAMENHLPGKAVPTIADLVPYVKSWPNCPSGGSYSLNAVDVPPACSFGGDHSL